MNQTVTYYGVHRTPEGVVYLHQGNGKAANFIQLSEPSPFKVMTGEEKQKACPHVINTSTPMPDREHWRTFMEIFGDSLTREFLPLPRHTADPVPFFENANDMQLLLLSKLSSPVYPVVHRFAHLTKARIASELALTNVAPLVLTHIEPKHQEAMEAYAILAKRSPRKLILSGDRNMVITPPMIRVASELGNFDEKKLFSLPMEQLGAVALRRWARGEQIDGLWER